MKKSIVFSTFFLLLALFVGSAAVYAQQKQDIKAGDQVMIQLKDGNKVSGTVVSINNAEVVVRSDSFGEVTIERTRIQSMDKIEKTDMKQGKYWFPNPNPSKFLFGQNAIPREKNTGYYQNAWVFFNSFNYAFTDWFSMTAGFELFSIIAATAGGSPPWIITLNPKVSTKVANNLYLGGDILYVNALKALDDFSGLFSFNGQLTYGNTNNNITAGLGWGMANGEFADRPFITVSGMARISRKLSFISENWLVPGVETNTSLYGVFSYGLRILGENTSFDIAFINNGDIAKGLGIGFPVINFLVSF